MISIVCYNNYKVLSNWRNLILIIRSASDRKGQLWESEFMITAWSFTLHKLVCSEEAPEKIWCAEAATAVADPGEGPRRTGPPFILGPNWGPKGRKEFLRDHPPPPFHLREWMTAPPPLYQGLDPPLYSDVED